MTQLNTNLNISETIKQETTDDLFKESTVPSPKKENPHLFDDIQSNKSKINITDLPKKSNGTSNEASNGTSSETKTKQQKKTKSKSTFFTLPIVILMIIILILIVVIIVVIRLKTKNTDILLEQSKEQLEELVKNINHLEEENKLLKQANSKLNNAVDTFKAENKQLMREISTSKQENFDVQQQPRSKSHAELKAEKFGISNNYIEKNSVKDVETVVEQPQEAINMTNELKATERKNEVEISTEEESDIENLLNN